MSACETYASVLFTRKLRRKVNVKKQRLEFRSKMNVPARWQETAKVPCRIYVFANGDINGPAVMILIIQRLMKSWDLVLSEITEKIGSRTGEAVRRLYTLHGELVVDPSQLEHGKNYVAVGRGSYKRLPYGERAQFLAMQHSPRRPAALPPIRRRVRTINSNPTDANQSYAQKHAQRRQLEEQRAQQAQAPRPERQRKLKPLKTSTAPPPSSDSDSVFHAKPVKVKRSGASGRLTQVSAAEDDVFRAKGDEVKAEEVEDDDDVKVDLPIDQMPADTVEDEEIPTKQDEDEERFQEKARSPTPPRSSRTGEIEAEAESERAKTPSSPSRGEPRSNQSDFGTPEGERKTSSRNGSAIPADEQQQPDTTEQKLNETEAATRIQTRYRGYRTRLDFERRRAEAAVYRAQPAEVEHVAKVDITADDEDDESAEIPQNLPLLTEPEPEETEPADEGGSQPDGSKAKEEEVTDAQLASDVQQPGSRAGSLEQEEQAQENDGEEDKLEEENAEEEKPEEGTLEHEEPQDPSLATTNEEHTVQDVAADEGTEDAEAPTTPEAKPVDVAEPSFDMATGQATERPRSKTPDEPEPEQAREDKLSLPERDDGDGTEENEGGKLNGSLEESEYGKSEIDENLGPNDPNEVDGEKESSPARPASQSPTGDTPADKILDKPTHEEKTIPNGQPAGLLEGDV